MLQIIEHVPFEGPGRIADWADARAVRVTEHRLYAGAALPSAAPEDWCVIMGGPMGALDDREHTWLPAEREWIRRAVLNGRRVLGVCLGAQLMAAALGAAVTRNPEREIGHFPVRLTPAGIRHPLLTGFPEVFTAFHWHGDTFAIPAGAEHLAESDACVHQAFSFGGRALGLQFHLEAGLANVRNLIDHCAADLQPGRFVQPAARLLDPEEDPTRTEAWYSGQQSLLFLLLENLLRA